MAVSKGEIVLDSQESQQLMVKLQRAEHTHCLFCGNDNPIGFKLDFRVERPGSVSAVFPCGALFQSYEATLHGGLTSALLDAAMTNCLFSFGIAAVTGELTVRYVSPVLVGEVAEVRANLEKNCAPLFYMASELRQRGHVVARSTAKFVERGWALPVGGGRV